MNEIILTADGSHSLLNIELNETYHSVHGAIGESQHVYIDRGLDFIHKRSNPAQINILEIGFGTGLNALLTLQYISSLSININYTTLEAFPLEKEIWNALNYASTKNLKNCFDLLHASSWESWNRIQPNFNLLKIKDTLQQVGFPQDHYNLIYFDAFSPSKQPDMWTLPALKKVVESMADNAILVTYCAKGQFKRDLKSLGLSIESLPGPPGKMEMVRATKVFN